MLIRKFGVHFKGFAALLLGLVTVSQAQMMWQTTHTNNEGGGYNSGRCVLKSASIKVRVGPAFLDVEEDVEIGVVGSLDLGNDGKSLEIVGDIGMPAGSAITGSLLWDGGKILQGKLLDRAIADSLYEDMVDRNSTPPVRPQDPLIIEKTGPNAYRFRIYPVALGYSRHLRLRYQLPATMTPNGLQMPLMAPITALFAGENLQVPVTIENGGQVPKVIFISGNGVLSEMVLPKTRLYSPQELGNQGETWDMWGNLTHSSRPSLIIQSATNARQVSFKSTFVSGQMAGNYLNLYSIVSPELLKAMNIRNATSLSFVVRNSKNSYEIPVSCDGGLASGCASLAFNGKSDYAWNDTLEWSAFDATGKLLAKAKMKSTVFDAPKDTAAAVTWSTAEKRFSEKKELPGGPVYGYVDDWASMLALPKDSVGAILMAFYNEKGVPRISNGSIKDVIPHYAEGQVPNNPNTTKSIATKMAAKFGSFGDVSAWRIEKGSQGLLLHIPGLEAGTATTVELFGLSGQRMGVWSSKTDRGGIQFNPQNLRPGVYLIKVRIAGQMMSKRIVL